MVRREVGAESTLAAGLAQRPRALLEAWLKQHQDHMDDIETATVQAGFAAVRQFETLPPVGPLPASTLRFETQLGRLTLLQSYFPPLVDCEFAFVPSDELAALVQESLALPAIDLRASDADLDHLSVLIVAPVTRQQLEAHKRTLQTVVTPVKAASAGLISKRSPLESLLRIGQPELLIRPLPPTTLSPDFLAQAWQSAIDAARTEANATMGGRGMFWYLRKRQLPYTAEISSATLRLAGSAAAIDLAMNQRADIDGVLPRLTAITNRMPTLARAETANLLAAPRLAVSASAVNKVFATSDLLRRSVFTALSLRADTTETGLGHDDVLDIARQFGDPRLGEGFDALVAAASDDTRADLQTEVVVKAVADSGVAPLLDRAVRELPVIRHADFALQLRDAAKAVDSTSRLKLLAGLRVEPT
jgi:hypothetical protein